MVSGLKSAVYEERLKEIGLQSLTQRRERYDMIQTFKILNSIDKVDYRIWFERINVERQIQTRLTTCSMNLVTKRSNREVRKAFFSQRVVNSWNKLPDDVKNSTNLRVFKYKYDEIFK